MTAKYFILVAVILVCEANIEIPGLEENQKCAKSEKECIISYGNKIIKVISKPYEKYGIEGYDPMILSNIDLPKPTNMLTQYFNIKMTGLGDTRILDVKFEEENGQKTIRATFEHNLKFAGQGKVHYHIDPDVSHEGPISGSFSGLRSTFTLPINMVKKGGQKYMYIGHETLVSVEMPNTADINKEEAGPFLKHPAAKEFVHQVKDNLRDYHQGLAEKLVNAFQTKWFEDTRKFFSNVPLLELKKSE